MTNRALHVRYLPVSPSTPARTLPGAPVITAVDLGDVELVSVHLRIPAGHAGTTGVRVDYSGATILPWSNPSQWIIGDDDALDFEVGFEVGRTLQVVTYNLDVVDHRHYLLCKVADLDLDVLAPVKLVDVRP